MTKRNFLLRRWPPQVALTMTVATVGDAIMIVAMMMYVVPIKDKEIVLQWPESQHIHGLRYPSLTSFSASLPDSNVLATTRDFKINLRVQTFDYLAPIAMHWAVHRQIQRSISLLHGIGCRECHLGSQWILIISPVSWLGGAGSNVWFCSEDFFHSHRVTLHLYSTWRVKESTTEGEGGTRDGIVHVPKYIFS